MGGATRTMATSFDDQNKLVLRYFITIVIVIGMCTIVGVHANDEFVVVGNASVSHLPVHTVTLPTADSDDDMNILIIIVNFVGLLMRIAIIALVMIVYCAFVGILSMIQFVCFLAAAGAIVFGTLVMCLLDAPLYVQWCIVSAPVVLFMIQEAIVRFQAKHKGD